MPTRAALFSIRKWVCTAVSEFPVADGGFGNVDAEGHTCREDTNQCRSNPSLTGLEEGSKGTAYTGLGTYPSRSIRVFDLCVLALLSRGRLNATYQIVEPVNGGVVVVWKTFAYRGDR